MYTILGKVIKGAQRGRDLGFPTANVILDQDIPQGIYVSRVTIQRSENRNQMSDWNKLDSRSRDNNSKVVGNDKLQAVTFIGNATTFGETEIKSETYILNFNQDLYDTMVKIELLEKIRENKKFESVEKLIQNIREDVEETKKYFERQVSKKKYVFWNHYGHPKGRDN